MNTATETNEKTIADLNMIGAALHNLYKANNDMTLKKAAVASGLSVNSIKSIFQGSRANIANYDALARALGTSLVEVVLTTFQKAEASSSEPTS